MRPPLTYNSCYNLDCTSMVSSLVQRQCLRENRGDLIHVCAKIEYFLPRLKDNNNNNNIAVLNILLE